MPARPLKVRELTDLRSKRGQFPMPPSARSSLPKGLSETLTVVAKTLIITAKISISAQKKEAGASFPDIDIIFFFCAFSSLSLSGISA